MRAMLYSDRRKRTKRPWEKRVSTMHEMSIAQNIVEIVEDTLHDDPRAMVKRVVVRVGAMVAVVPDSLSFCYEAITDGTRLAGSTLVVEEIPVRIRCKACGRAGELETFVFRCPHCGSTGLTVFSGDELVVGHIEVEE